MSVSGTSNANFNFALLNQLGKDAKSGSSASERGAEAGSFAATLSLRLAEFKSQTFSTLMSTALGSDGAANSADFNALLGSHGDTAGAGAAISGLSPTGRNTSLFDPESAYGMMSVINNKDVTYKAQFSELSEMKSELVEMQEHGQHLGQIGAASDNASIKAQLAQFANEYNEWTRRFDEDMQSGGLLADTQAAQVARYELKQSIENIFFGVADGGVRGMGELGLRIDPVSKLASLDTAQLDAQLTSNKQGVVATIHAFGVNFAKSAELLNSQGNFIPNRLDNLDRVIDYIDANKAALQAEFGLGDSARPTGLVARALAAYQQDYAG